MVSKKQNYDNLSLFEKTSKWYKKLQTYLQEQNESIKTLKYMFSDEMKRWNFNSSN